MHVILLKMQWIFNRAFSLTGVQLARTIAIFCSARARFTPRIDRARA
jgi:hypothetical protein